MEIGRKLFRPNYGRAGLIKPAGIFGGRKEGNSSLLAQRALQSGTVYAVKTKANVGIFMIVQNVIGSGGDDCNCESWLDHWEKGTGQKARACSARGCPSTAEVGGHITTYGLLGMKQFIVPLCQAHNLGPREVDIYDSTQMVSANVRDTCGKTGLLGGVWP